MNYSMINDKYIAINVESIPRNMYIGDGRGLE